MRDQNSRFVGVRIRAKASTLAAPCVADNDANPPFLIAKTLDAGNQGFYLECNRCFDESRADITPRAAIFRINKKGDLLRQPRHVARIIAV
jgi:hypothetical protein